MKKFKHTPGPWCYSILGPHRNNKEVLAIEINYGNFGECIADTVYEEADARLIAAAPEMLEAIVYLLRVTDLYRTGGDATPAGGVFYVCCHHRTCNGYDN